MKNLICILTVLLLNLLIPSLLSANVAPKEIKVSSEIKRVTVFRIGAQVTREAKATIPTGNSLLKFTGISPQIDKSSIQVKGEGNFSILAVNHQLNYFEEPSKTQQILDLEKEYRAAKADPAFSAQMDDLWAHYVGRPSPLYFAERLTEHLGGAKRDAWIESVLLMVMIICSRSQADKSPS